MTHRSSNRKKSKQAGSKTRRGSKTSFWLYGGIGVLAVLLIATGTVFLPAMSGGIRGVRVYEHLSTGHTTLNVNYDPVPPVGGMHDPVPQNCGVYTEPVRDENAVHSLEHGAIWITYRPDLPSDQLETLQSITRQSAYRLLSPYPGIKSPIIVSAWGYQLKLKKADDPRLMRFIELYEQNPNGPEPGAACSGGVGAPLP